jgi:hypothetical protein
MPAQQVRISWGAERVAVFLTTVIVLCLVALRSTFGASFYDDSHYVSVALRIAQGARPFADEMSVQSLGFLPAALLTWLWTHLFGTTGLVIALRLSYVALATGVGTFAYIQLRRSFHPLVAALAVALPLLCPPFNLFAPGYNQMTTLGFVAAIALAHRAEHDRSPAAAAGTGIALVFASVTYPPLSIAAFALAVILIARTRERRIVVPLLVAGVAAASLFAAWLLATVSIDDIRTGLRYATANVTGFRTPAEKLQRTAQRLTDSLAQPTLWPMWAVALAACLPRIPRRIRALLLLALPVLALARSVQAFTFDLHVFGITAGAWLITFTMAAVVPVALWAYAEKKRDLVSLILLAVPVSAIGFLIVAYSTASPWLRGVAVIGIVPAAMAVGATWGSAIEALWSERALAVGALLLVVIAVGMLWSESVDNGKPLAMTAMMDHGAYAGMHMSPVRHAEILGVEAAGKRWVKPGARVTFYGERQGYLATAQGRIFTNAVWLYPSRTDWYALEYFREHNAMPDVVFVDHFSMRLRRQLPYEHAAKDSTFLNRLLKEYSMVESVADFGVWVKRR